MSFSNFSQRLYHVLEQLRYHKDYITDLYQKGFKLTTVREVMQQKFGVEASESQYKRCFAQWGLRKNRRRAKTPSMNQNKRKFAGQGIATQSAKVWRTSRLDFIYGMPSYCLAYTDQMATPNLHTPLTDTIIKYVPQKLDTFTSHLNDAIKAGPETALCPMADTIEYTNGRIVSNVNLQDNNHHPLYNSSTLMHSRLELIAQAFLMRYSVSQIDNFALSSLSVSERAVHNVHIALVDAPNAAPSSVRCVSAIKKVQAAYLYTHLGRADRIKASREEARRSMNSLLESPPLILVAVLYSVVSMEVYHRNRNPSSSLLPELLHHLENEASSRYRQSHPIVNMIKAIRQCDPYEFILLSGHDKGIELFFSPPGVLDHVHMVNTSPGGFLPMATFTTDVAVRLDQLYQKHFHHDTISFEMAFELQQYFWDLILVYLHHFQSTALQILKRQAKCEAYLIEVRSTTKQEIREMVRCSVLQGSAQGFLELSHDLEVAVEKILPFYPYDTHLQTTEVV